MQIWGSAKKCQNYRFFDILWDVLDIRNSKLGQDCVKRGLPTFQSKIGTIAPDLLGKMKVLQFWPYFSTCPSQASDIPTN